MLRTGVILARRGASTGGGVASSSRLQSTLFRRNAALVVVPQRSGGHGPITPLWTLRPNQGFISRKDVEPDWNPPPPGRKKPEYESPLMGPNELDTSFNVPHDFDLYWEDGIQREYIFDFYAPDITPARALRMFITAFLVLWLFLMILGFLFPHADIAVPPVLPREVLERDFLVNPKNKEFLEDYQRRAELRTMRAKLAAADDTRVTFFDQFEIFIKPVLVGSANLIINIKNRIFGPSTN